MDAAVHRAHGYADRRLDAARGRIAAIGGYVRILRVTSKNVAPKRARTHFLTPGDIEASPFIDVKSRRGDLANCPPANSGRRRRTPVSIAPEIQSKVRSFAQEWIEQYGLVFIKDTNMKTAGSRYPPAMKLSVRGFKIPGFRNALLPIDLFVYNFFQNSH